MDFNHQADREFVAFGLQARVIDDGRVDFHVTITTEQELDRTLDGGLDQLPQGQIIRPGVVLFCNEFFVLNVHFFSFREQSEHDVTCPLIRSLLMA